VETFGKIDILINNTGIVNAIGPAVMDTTLMAKVYMNHRNRIGLAKG